MATPNVLTFDAEGRVVDFEVWVDDLQLFLEYDRADELSLFDLTSGASPAPRATADSTSVGAASAPSGKRRIGKGKEGKGAGGAGGGGGGGGGGSGGGGGGGGSGGGYTNTIGSHDLGIPNTNYREQST
ncbi:unnamed protein product [Closterium sp. NIES-65]|nr:unnamed protein product [Closterium sp. NIES-65]